LKIFSLNVSLVKNSGMSFLFFMNKFKFLHMLQIVCHYVGLFATLLNPFFKKNANILLPMGKVVILSTIYNK